MKTVTAISIQARCCSAALVALLLGLGCASPTGDKTKPVASSTAKPGHAVVRSVRGPAEVSYLERGNPTPGAQRCSIGFRQGYAVVRAVRGQAEYSNWTGDRWRRLNVGWMLQSGASVRTLPDSEVDLFLKQNGPIVRVTPGTVLTLEQLSYQERPDETVIVTVLTVPKGRILAAVKKLAPGSLYEIRTPEGVTRVRGTQLGVSHDGEVTVCAGLVEFITAAGRFEIRAGQTFDPGRRIIRRATVDELRRVKDLQESARGPM